MALWHDVGLPPWRFDGYPDDYADVPTLEYWANHARGYQAMRALAESYTASLDAKERQSRAESALTENLARLDRI